MNSISWFIFFIAILCSFHILEAFETGLVFSTKFERLDEYYDGKRAALNVVADRCNISFSGPMMIYDNETKSHEVGYELYYRKGDLKNDMECTRFDHFKEITDDYINKLKNFDITMSALQKDDTTEVGNKDVKSKIDIGTKFEYLTERSFVFYWISVLSFRFQPSKNQISVFLNADIVNDYNLKMKCDNYELGKDLYMSEENFYPFSKEVRGSIVKTPLVPLQYLHTKAGKLAGCTELNSIPVWNNVAERLNLIDRSLYALYREKDINPKINMYFGVSDNIKTIKKESNDDGSDNNDIDQTEKGNESSEEKEILMPKILYRVVKYTDVIIDDNGITPVMIKLLVIIIHNERNGVTNKDRLCRATDMSDIKVLWNEKIKKEEGILSYACAPDSEMLKKLGVLDERSTKSYSTLSIKEQFDLEFTDNVKEPIVKIKKAPEEKIQ